MIILGCDFHPSWQQVAWLDTETGETVEQKLLYAAGEVKLFYKQLLPFPALIGMEATGSSQWFIELVEDLGAHDLDRRCGADPYQLRAQAEDGQTGRGAYPETGGGRTFSEAVDARPRPARPAAAGAASAQAGGDTQPGKKRTATPLSE